MLQLSHCKTATKRKNTSYTILILVPLAGALFSLSACIVVTILLKKKSQPERQADQSGKELRTFTYSELAKATNEFSSTNLVGSGRFGLVYKGTLEFEDNLVAIKVFKHNIIGASRNFLAECDVLRNTRHRNLMRVISLCSSLDRAGNEFRALILEYMSNGSLQMWIHSEVPNNTKKRRLTLGSRIMIAVDIAAAVHYLHNCCTPPLVHCDLKPSNVLLDDDMVAHVSDFGLAKFLINHSPQSMDIYSSTNIIGPRGSIGYIPPEYGMGCEISTAGDVYSFGVILLEMLTGKHPTDELLKDGLNLHKFVQSAFPENFNEVLDSSLIPSYEVEEANHDSNNWNLATVRRQRCIRQLAQLGLECTLESPKFRPTMQDVYSEIMAIKEIFSASQC